MPTLNRGSARGVRRTLATPTPRPVQSADTGMFTPRKIAAMMSARLIDGRPEPVVLSVVSALTTMIHAFGFTHWYRAPCQNENGLLRATEGLSADPDLGAEGTAVAIFHASHSK